MPYCVYFQNYCLRSCDYAFVSLLKDMISQKYGMDVNDLVATIHGKRVADDYVLESFNNIVRISPKLVGGKGGFGSMLRAIGAQIEKTSNREACRDLSGRRLRYINEERLLKKWIEGRAKKELEIKKRKQKKIERVIAGPKIEVELTLDYERKRQDVTVKAFDALDVGWQMSGPSGNDSGIKRKAKDDKTKGKKKTRLWIDADITDCSSLSDDEDVEVPALAGISIDSGNESDHPIYSNNTIHIFVKGRDSLEATVVANNVHN